MEKIIATGGGYKALIERLRKYPKLAIDTETYGLLEEHRLFSIIICSEELAVYFNYDDTPDYMGNYAPKEHTLSRETLADFIPLTTDPSIIWYMHNAKFDLHMLAKEGLHFLGDVICTMVQARVAYNTHNYYSLAACSRRIGIEKSDLVEECISANRLYSWVERPGKKGKSKDKHFALVPFDTITEYGFIDVINTLAVGAANEQAIQSVVSESLTQHGAKLQEVATNEAKLTKVCFKMERSGILIDRGYIQKALAWELCQVQNGKIAFKDICGLDYGNGGPKILSEAFAAVGATIALTDKGNKRFDKVVLEMTDSPISTVIKQIRNHEKNAGTYYSSFIYHSDEKDVLRATINQAGTETGRFSYYSPNLQNIPKEEEGLIEGRPYLVRASFISREDYYYVMLDYDQQEFRLMLDYAGEHEVIARVNAGEDVHQATADLMGVSRSTAKSLNFGLLYGMGTGKLSQELGVPFREAADLKAHYFQELPGIMHFTRKVIDTGAARGFVVNWKGRYCRLPRGDRRMAYALPNHLIQGGCADVIKTAMVEVDALLTSRQARSQVLIQVHDELVLEVHKDELCLVPQVRKIMEGAYAPRNGMRLTCSVDHSPTSWGQNDRIEGEPNAAIQM